MTFAQPLRTLIGSVRRQGLRTSYWSAALIAGEVRALYQHQEPALRRHFRDHLTQYLYRGVIPVSGETRPRLHAAAAWLLRAQAATPDDGVSQGYFPCDPIHGGWAPSYPETTGYIITSLLRYARRYGRPAAANAALRMGRWEREIQMESGAVQGGALCAPERRTPAAFNTGMVLDGYCSLLEEELDDGLYEAAARAARFLVDDLGPEGYFRTNGRFVSADRIKTYNVLCAWALYRFAALGGDRNCSTAAIRAVEAALRQQQTNGWFADNCLTAPAAPLTHTIGYTLQGILEVGVLAGREDFLDAARQGLLPLLARVERSGFLSGRFLADWTPAAPYACLTGSAQVAVIAYRVGELTRDRTPAAIADRLVNYLKALQKVDSPIPAINGALAGSYPFFGSYMHNGYPNWATKYFLDALMSQDEAGRN